MHNPISVSHYMLLRTIPIKFYRGLTAWPPFTVFQALKQRDEALSREVELLKEKLEELEKLARGRGLSGIISFKRPDTESAKSVKPA